MYSKSWAQSDEHAVQVSEAAPSAAAQAPAAPPPTEPIVISVTEKVMVALNKDGGVRDMEVQGQMLLQACFCCVPTVLRSHNC